MLSKRTPPVSRHAPLRQVRQPIHFLRFIVYKHILVGRPQHSRQVVRACMDRQRLQRAHSYVTSSREAAGNEHRTAEKTERLMTRTRECYIPCPNLSGGVGINSDCGSVSTRPMAVSRRRGWDHTRMEGMLPHLLPLQRVDESGHEQVSRRAVVD